MFFKIMAGLVHVYELCFLALSVAILFLGGINLFSVILVLWAWNEWNRASAYLLGYGEVNYENT